jgi:SAM-dependent methyltransferase
MTLKEIQEKHHFITDKDAHHSYFDVYQAMFESRQEDPISLLELGIYKGGSLLLWKEFFPQGKIFGVDRKDHVFRDDLNVLIKSEIVTMIMDYDMAAAETFHPLMFDYVIDDLSHDIFHQIKTFSLFKSKIKPNGYLIIEDIRPENFHYWNHIAEITPNCMIVDRRHVKNRIDDVLFVYQNL